VKDSNPEKLNSSRNTDEPSNTINEKATKQLKQRQLDHKQTNREEYEQEHAYSD
jgi:hypothetical protein